MKVLEFPNRRRPADLDNLEELLAGRLQTWSQLLRIGAGPGTVLAEMRRFLERYGFRPPGGVG